MDIDICTSWFAPKDVIRMSDKQTSPEACHAFYAMGVMAYHILCEGALCTTIMLLLAVCIHVSSCHRDWQQMTWS